VGRQLLGRVVARAGIATVRASGGRPTAVCPADGRPQYHLARDLRADGASVLLTRRRVIPDMAARAPERSIALRETVIVLAYAALGQVGGWIVGPALGYRAFSFHIAGTVFGCSVLPKPTEVFIWASYNFVIFAVAPTSTFGVVTRILSSIFAPLIAATTRW